MTATPAQGKSVPLGSICTIFFTPGTAFAFASSKLTTLAPNAGERLTTAYSIPGKRTSIP